MTTTNKIKWTSENSYYLLRALQGYRPFGVRKHLHMMFIHEEFKARSGLSPPTDVLWDYIEELYNINVMTEKELEELKKKPVEAYSLDQDTLDYKRVQALGTK